MQIVSRTGCSDPSECKEKILAGLDGVYELILNAAQSKIKDFTGQITSKVPLVTDVIRVAQEEAPKIIQQAQGIADKVLAYLKNTFDGYQKFPIGRVCSAPGTGVWWMQPTDCGALDAMVSIFSSFQNAPTAFQNTVNSLNTCVQKVGIWGAPTPFMDLKVIEFCLPQPIVIAMEYFMGTILWASNVAITIVQDITKVVETLIAFLNKAGLKLPSLGVALQQLDTSSNTSSMVESANECGPHPDWAVRAGLGFGISFPMPPGTVPASLGVSLSIAIVVGCKFNKLQFPNWVLGFGFSQGLIPKKADPTKPPPVPEASGKLSIGFQVGYPAFSNRVTFGAGLEVTPTLDIKDFFPAIPIAVSVPFAFGVLPNPLEPPSSFSMGFKLANSDPKPALAELSTRVKEASKVAGKQALMRRASTEEHATEDDYAAGTFAATAAAFSVLADGLQDSLAHAEAPSVHEVLKEAIAVQQAAPALHQNHQHATGVSVDATQSVSFCITPVECFGQTPYHLAPAGASRCDYGTTPPQNKCLEAANILATEAGKTMGRATLQVGSGGTCNDGGWGQVPSGCSVQSAGDWTAHFKTSASDCAHSAYQLVCDNRFTAGLR